MIYAIVFVGVPLCAWIIWYAFLSGREGGHDPEDTHI